MNIPIPRYDYMWLKMNHIFILCLIDSIAGKCSSVCFHNMAQAVAIAKWFGILVLFLTRVGGERVFDRCSLAREMDDLGVPRDELARWVCIAEHESSYRTWIVGPPNSDGSRDHGIFQINDRYWCLPSDGRRSSNGCNVNCDALRTDSINRAVRCAQQVLRAQGWGAWSVYRPKCSGQLPSIEDCFRGGQDPGLAHACFKAQLY